jgi:hypothetical protein
MRRLLLWFFILFGAFAFTLAQSRSESTEIEKLNLEKAKFDYAKHQSTRNLILGFVLTTIGGAYVTWLFSTRTWHRQTTIDLYRKRFEEGTAFLDSFAKAVGERYYLLQRFLWALGDADPQRIKRTEKEYFVSVVAWNTTYWVNRNKIRLLVDDTQANAFLDYKDDFNQESPQSLHYLFVKAHRYVKNVKAKEISADVAQVAVDDLNWACSTFLENLTTSFLDKAVSLQLLKSPAFRPSSLKAAIKQRPRMIPPRLWDATDVLKQNSPEQSGPS